MQLDDRQIKAEWGNTGVDAIVWLPLEKIPWRVAGATVVEFVEFGTLYPEFPGIFGRKSCSELVWWDGEKGVQDDFSALEIDSDDVL